MSTNERDASTPKVTATAESDTNHRDILVALYWLLGLAVLYSLYLAKTLLVPIVVAMLLSLMLSPLVGVFKRFYVPRTISAILLLALIGGPFTLLGFELVKPAQKWLSRLPEFSARMTKDLDTFAEAIAPEEVLVPVAPETPPPPPPPSPPKKKRFTFFGLFGGDVEEPAAAPATAPAPTMVKVPRANPLSQRMVQGGIEVFVAVLVATPLIMAQILVFVILLLFLLIFGPSLYDNFIGLDPRVKDKHRAGVLLHKVQWALSRYILTVCLINTGLGVVTATVLRVMGVEDAILWGALVGLLNFAPYVGPLISLCILSIAGIVQYDLSMKALLPAIMYFGINMIEAQFITPLVLGRHMQLNPLILTLWLIIWGWLWGAAGVLLAVPLLVCFKLAAEQINVLENWVVLIGVKEE